MESSLVVQWLRLHAPNAGGTGSITGQGRPHMPYGMAKNFQKLKNKKNGYMYFITESLCCAPETNTTL